MITHHHLDAAEHMDWQQVALNNADGRPDSQPCFHLGDDGKFCGRAERWEGHTNRGGPALHKFVSLKDLLQTA